MAVIEDDKLNTKRAFLQGQARSEDSTSRSEVDYLSNFLSADKCFPHPSSPQKNQINKVSNTVPGRCWDTCILLSFIKNKYITNLSYSLETPFLET